MERRRAATVAGAAAVTVIATILGLGATFGLFGLTEPDSPGAGVGHAPLAVSPADGVVPVPAPPAVLRRDD